MKIVVLVTVLLTSSPVLNQIEARGDHYGGASSSGNSRSTSLKDGYNEDEETNVISFIFSVMFVAGFFVFLFLFIRFLKKAKRHLNAGNSEPSMTVRPALVIGNTTLSNLRNPSGAPRGATAEEIDQPPPAYSSVTEYHEEKTLSQMEFEPPPAYDASTMKI